MDIFSIFFSMKVCCVFSLESPHRGDSNEYTQYTIFNIFNIRKKITLKLSQICSYEFLFQGTQERVRNSLGKRANSVRATEVLLYACSNVFLFRKAASKACTMYCDKTGLWFVKQDWISLNKISSRFI